VTERQRTIWVIAAGFGALFVFFNVFDLVFVEGDVGRDLFTIALGAVLTLVAIAKARGWKGLD
jgi:hypothetical protein